MFFFSFKFASNFQCTQPTMYANRCEKTQVQRNSCTLFRVLTTLKRVKAGLSGNFLSLKHRYALILHILKVMNYLMELKSVTLMFFSRFD